VTYYTAIAAQLTPKGAAPIPQTMALGAARALPGQRPAASMDTTVVETVTIQSVDKDANTVTFLRQDGTVDTAAVHSSEGRTFIAGLKSGDQVDVALSEAVAISVDPSH
jgi:translation elongation factor P/translation initiation factor 5A